MSCGSIRRSRRCSLTSRTTECLIRPDGFRAASQRDVGPLSCTGEAFRSGDAAESRRGDHRLVHEDVAPGCVDDAINVDHPTAAQHARPTAAVESTDVRRRRSHRPPYLPQPVAIRTDRDGPLHDQHRETVPWLRRQSWGRHGDFVLICRTTPDGGEPARRTSPSAVKDATGRNSRTQETR